MAVTDFSVEELRERFAYDPETGVLTYRRHFRAAWVGKPVHIDYRRGYARTRIRRMWVLIHRIAWVLQTGTCPAMIDHINGDRADNRWANLRETDPFLNQQNRLKPKNGTTSGLLGAIKRKDRFGAAIWHNGVQINIGTYDTPEEAHAAYMAAKRRLHPHAFAAHTDYTQLSQLVVFKGSSARAGGPTPEPPHAPPSPCALPLEASVDSPP